MSFGEWMLRTMGGTVSFIFGIPVEMFATSIFQVLLGLAMTFGGMVVVLAAFNALEKRGIAR